MSNAKKCDRCSKLYSGLNHTLSGSISTRAIAWGLAHYSPEHYDFCQECTNSLIPLIRTWFKEGWCKLKEVSDE